MHKKSVKTGQNQFFEATEPSKTGLKQFGCSCPKIGNQRPRLWLLVAHFGALRPDQTGL